MNVTLVIKELFPRKFEVTATCGKDSATGTGSAAYVAASRAIHNLVLYAGNRQDPVAPPAAEPVVPVAAPVAPPAKPYYISTGRHQGEVCTYMATVATLEDTEVWEVEYPDGTTGHEKSRYLNAIAQ